MKWITVRMQHICRIHETVSQSQCKRMFIFKRIHYKSRQLFISHLAWIACSFWIVRFFVYIFVFANRVWCKHVETCKVWLGSVALEKISYDLHIYTNTLNGKDKATTRTMKFKEKQKQCVSNSIEIEIEFEMQTISRFYCNFAMRACTVLFKVSVLVFDGQ